MAVSKSKKGVSGGFPLSEDLLTLIANRFKVLAVPMRLRILHSLQQGELTVSEIMEVTGASQANASKHLGVMTRADMVQRRKDGLRVFYSIADPVIFELCDLVCNRAQSARPR